jgi:8-oxo-dGTP pyrophosphatase MutT (NUDIX family)
MLREKSAGAVIFKRNEEIRYLLLHYRYKTDYWDFPKGNIEEREKEEETIRREIKEETEIEDIKFVNGFREKINYFYKREGQSVSKEVVYYLVETSTGNVKISEEHVGYEWVDSEEAMKRLKENSKKVLEKADKFLGNGLGKWLH